MRWQFSWQTVLWIGCSIPRPMVLYSTHFGEVQTVWGFSSGTVRSIVWSTTSQCSQSHLIYLLHMELSIQTIRVILASIDLITSVTNVTHVYQLHSGNFWHWASQCSHSFSDRVDGHMVADIVDRKRQNVIHESNSFLGGVVPWCLGMLYLFVARRNELGLSRLV